MPKAAPPSPRSETLGTATADRDALVLALLPLTTFLIVCYEIVLTRVFAYIFVYRLTALAVSFAVFGIGAGAYVRVRWLGKRSQPSLALIAHVAAGLSIFVMYMVLMLTHHAVTVVVLSAIPFVCAGIAVSHYYEARQSERAAETYALDLAGASVACVVSVYLVSTIGGDRSLLLLAAWCGGTALLASLRAGSTLERRGEWLSLAMLCIVLPAAAYAFHRQLPDPLLNPRAGVEKQLPRLLRERGKVIDSAWSAVGRADMFELSPKEDKAIFSDAMDSTVFLANTPEGLQGLFAALPYAIGTVRSTLVLGSGGGLEVRIAHDAGVTDIDAVELNSGIVQLVRRWQAFGGPTYDQPGVRLFVEEGRRFMTTSRRRYDLIQMSLVLTASAQSGTYALAEGYLYTQEAFRSYLEHLEPDGVLAMIDDSFERTLKNTVTAESVLERMQGVRSMEAMKHIAVVFNRRKDPAYKYLLLVSPTPLSDTRKNKLAGEVPTRSLDPLWIPGKAANPQFQALANIGAELFARGAVVNLSPPTDDKPYLNYFAKTAESARDVLQPYIVLSVLVALVLVGMFAADAMSPNGVPRSTVLAALYGVGFMFMELGLLHKLTLAAGGPAAALSVLLFSLLLCCGLGSLLFGRFARPLRTRLGSLAILAAIVGVVTAEIVERAYRLERVSAPALRALCVFAMVAPLGLCLGAPFPDLLRRYSRWDEHRIAYLWAVNGVASVLGGGLVLLMMPTFGGQIVLWTGSALYFVAWAIDRKR